MADETRDVLIVVRLDGKNASRSAKIMKDSLEESLKKTGAQVKSTGKVVEDFGDKSEKGFKKTGASAVAAGQIVARAAEKIAKDVLRFTGDITDSTLEFRKSAALVGNLDAPIGQVKDAIAGMDAVLGDQTQLLDAYFKVYSGGVTDTADSVSLLNDAARLSFAEQADLTSTVQAGIKVWNIYGSELGSTTEAFETLSAIAQIGDTNLQAVSSSISRLLPSGKALGLALEEVGGTLAVLTQVSGSTEMAVTNLSSLFRSFNNESAQAKAAAKELQIEWSGASVQAQGFTTFLGNLREALEGTGKAEAEQSKLIQDLTGSAEAANALLPLLGDSFDKLDDAIKKTGESSDIITPKLARMKEAIGPVVALENAWTNMQIELGEQVAPAMLEVTELFIEMIPLIKTFLEQLPLLATATALAFSPQIIGQIKAYTAAMKAAGFVTKGATIAGLALVAVDIGVWFLDQETKARNSAITIKQVYLDALAAVNDDIDKVTKGQVRKSLTDLTNESVRLNEKMRLLVPEINKLKAHPELVQFAPRLKKLQAQFDSLRKESRETSKAIDIQVDRLNELTAAEIEAAKVVTDLAAKEKAEALEKERQRLALEKWNSEAKDAAKIMKEFAGMDQQISSVNREYDDHIRLLREHNKEGADLSIAIMNVNTARADEIKRIRESNPIIKALQGLQEEGIELFKRWAENSKKASEESKKAAEEEKKLNEERKANLDDLINTFGSFGQRQQEITDHYQEQRDKIMALDSTQITLVDRMIMMANATASEAEEQRRLNEEFDNGKDVLKDYIDMLSLLGNVFGQVGQIAGQLNLPGGELLGGLGGGLGGITQGMSAFSAVATSGLTGMAAGLAKFSATLTIAMGAIQIAQALLPSSKSFDDASAQRFVDSLGIEAAEVVASIQAEIAKLREAGLDKFAARDIAELHGIPALIEAAGRLEQAQLDKLLWGISHGVDALGNSWKAWSEAVPATLALLDQVDRGFVSWTDHLGDVVSAIVQTGNATAEMMSIAIKNAPDGDFIKRLFDDIAIGAGKGLIGEDLFIESLELLLGAVEEFGIDAEAQIFRVIEAAQELGFSLASVADEMVGLVAEGFLAWSEPIATLIEDVFAAGDATDELFKQLSDVASDEFIRDLFGALAEGAQAGTLSIGQLTRELIFLMTEATERGLDLREELRGIIAAAKGAGFELGDFTIALESQLQFEKDTLRGIRDEIQSINKEIQSTVEQIKGMDKSIDAARLSAFKQRQFVLPEARQTLQEQVGADTFQRIQQTIEEMTQGLTETLTFKEMKDLTLSVEAQNQQAVLAFLETVNQTVRLDQQIVELQEQKQLAIDSLAELREQKQILKQEARETQKEIRGIRRDIKWIQNHWNNIQAVDRSVDSIDGKMDTNNERLSKIIEELEKIPKFASGGFTSGGLVVTHPGEFIVSPPAVESMQRGASLSFPSAPSQPAGNQRTGDSNQTKIENHYHFDIHTNDSKSFMDQIDDVMDEMVEKFTEKTDTGLTSAISIKRVD